jgi:hypothetical protein
MYPGHPRPGPKDKLEMAAAGMLCVRALFAVISSSQAAIRGDYQDAGKEQGN